MEDETELEIEITQEMIEAGSEAFSHWMGYVDDEDCGCSKPRDSNMALLSSAIFRSMLSASPVSLRKFLSL